MRTNYLGPSYANPPQAKKIHIPQHKNIQAIFEQTYRVLIKQRDTKSIEEQREHGVIRTGDKKMDEAMDNNLQSAYLTINDMIELYRVGVNFYLTAETDSKKIFEAVTAHTGEWRQHLRYSYNMGTAPVEDLILMERFVQTIYEFARFEFEKRPEFNAATGTLAAFLYSNNSLTGSFERNGVINRAITDERVTTPIKDLKYNPDIDVFQRAMVERAGLM